MPNLALMLGIICVVTSAPTPNVLTFPEIANLPESAYPNLVKAKTKKTPDMTIINLFINYPPIFLQLG
jgi:hypothetical protein